jgi:hypothetical protein
MHPGQDEKARIDKQTVKANMSDPKKSNAKSGRPSSPRPKSFPDIATCRVMRSEYDKYLYCLGVWKELCPYGLAFGAGKFCTHPARFEILAGLEKSPRKLAD